MKALVLEAAGVRKQDTIYQAEKDMKEGRFETFEELCKAIRSW